MTTGLSFSSKQLALIAAISTPEQWARLQTDLVRQGPASDDDREWLAGRARTAQTLDSAGLLDAVKNAKPPESLSARLSAVAGKSRRA